MKKMMIPIAVAALLCAAGCKRDSLQNTVWLKVDSVMNTTGTARLVLDSTTLDFIDDESGKYKNVHITDRNTTVDRAVFYYTYEGTHGCYSVNETYEFDVKGSTMEVHLKNVPESDTVFFTKIYDEKGK